MEIAHYTTEDGTDVYQKWADALRDNRARIAVLRRVDRAAMGNFGDHKACRDGVSEMRIDVGPGYRVYISSMLKRWLCSCAGATSAARTRISARPLPTGPISCAG
jgi:putative addiction module killer protein